MGFGWRHERRHNAAVAEQWPRVPAPVAGGARVRFVRVRHPYGCGATGGDGTAAAGLFELTRAHTYMSVACKS